MVMQPTFCALKIHGFSEAAVRMVLDFLLDHNLFLATVEKMARRAIRAILGISESHDLQPFALRNGCFLVGRFLS